MTIPPVFDRVRKADPKYVERGGEVVYRHPFDARGCRMWLFAPEADLDMLGEFCDRVFNEPSHGQLDVQPASPYVLLNFVDILHLSSHEPPDNALGSVHYREAGIWAPVTVTMRSTGQTRNAWAIPYMFADSGAALTGGREIFGYPKQLGWVKIRKDVAALESRTRNTADAANVGGFGHSDDLPRGSLALLLQTKTLDRTGPDAEAKEHDLVLLSMPSIAAASDPDLKTKREAKEAIEKRGKDGGSGKAPSGDASNMVGGGWSILLRLFEEMFTGAVPMVLLKQFRDAADPRRACYQAIVTAEHRVRDLRGARLLPPPGIKIMELDGEPMVSELGLLPEYKPDNNVLGVWVDFDFVIDRAEVLWEANTTGR